MYREILASVLDITIVSALIYIFIKLLSRSKQNIYILIGILVYCIAYFLARILNLQLLSYILAQVYTWGFIIIVIIFQSEIRTSISKIGSFGSLFKNDQKQDVSYLGDFAKTMVELGKNRIGALVVFEQGVDLSSYKRNAIAIDGNYSPYLLKSIFLKESPLHDGGVIIEDGKIDCASAYFPIAVDLNLDQKYGTRHRAALTLSRESDAIVVIVSEESGKVSIAYGGELIDNVDEEFLEMFLKEKIQE